MFDEFLEEYKYNWKMADNQYTEERYRNSLSPKQVEKAQSSPTTSILLRIKWALKNLKMRIEAARFSNSDDRVFNFSNSFDCVIGMEHIDIRNNIV